MSLERKQYEWRYAQLMKRWLERLAVYIEERMGMIEISLEGLSPDYDTLGDLSRKRK